MRRKNRKLTVYIVWGGLLCVLVYSGIALAKNASDKAKSTVDETTYIKKLKQRIKKDPNNGEPLFQLAVRYIETGIHSQAHKLFSQAVRLNPTYGNRVASVYMKAGNEKLRDGRIRQSRILFQKAVKFDPRLKANIAKNAFLEGKGLFDQGLYELADERFAVANSMNDSYGSEICDMFFALGNAVDQKRCLELYSLASWYCSDHNEEIGLRLLEIAKNHTSKEWEEVYKEEASKYVSDETILAVFPTPSWETVHASIYAGKGYDENNSPEYHIRTVQFGKDVKNGDKIVVESEGGFKIWDAGWEACDLKCELFPKNKTSGEFFYVEAPKDKKIIVKVQRYH